MTPSPIPTKVCATCKRELELGLFSVIKRSKDGHNSHCRTCYGKKAKAMPSYKKYNKTGGKKWQRMNLNNEPD